MGRDLRAGRKGSFPGTEEQVKKYAGMNENELMTNLMESARRGRENGTLSNGDLDAMFLQVSPMLSPQQRTKMKGLIEMLKAQQ